jgi:uracil-DNA glycosylase
MGSAPVLSCPDFPCGDVDHGRFTPPSFTTDPASVRLVLIAEAPPTDASDWFWASGDPFFWQTTRQALAEAGLRLRGVEELAGHGIHLTTAIKCAKVGYGVSAATIAACSERILEQELAVFPNIEVIALMGDVAIKALNAIARRADGRRLVPAGATWRIRGRYDWNGVTVIPSYLTTGRSYLIEASKRDMIAEDLRAALGAARIL